MTLPIPVLLYHCVGSEPSEWIAPFTVTAATFRRHLDLIVTAGLTAITVSDLRAGLSGRHDLPERPVLITFDDGFADTLDVAAPMLALQGYPATVYLTSGFLNGRSPGGDRMLSWSGARELVDLGHEIGAHSVTHPQLDALPQAAAWTEIVDSRHHLEQRLGCSVRSFAYPHGYSSAAVRRLVQQAGYESACSVKNRLSCPSDPAYTIARLTVTAATTDQTIEGWLTGSGRIASRHDLLSTRIWRTYRRSLAQTARVTAWSGAKRS